MAIADPKFYRFLPKVELHAHINGSISEATMEKLIREKESYVDENWRLMYRRGDHGTLEDVFNMFRCIHAVTDNAKAIYQVTYDVIHEFADDNVKYLELRTTPREEISTGMTKVAYIESVLKAIDDCAKLDLDIIVRLLLAIDRRQSVAVAMETLQLAIKYRQLSGDVIVGIDLSGNPTVGNAEDFIPVFNEAKRHNLKLAVHLAEVPSPEETMAVLQILPDRIGHGTCIQPVDGGTKELQDFLLEHRIPLELCLTSNIVAKTVQSYNNHHFKFWYEHDHPCIICTDDKGVFCTSLSEEYSIAADTFQLSPDQVWQLSLNSIDFIFADENLKSSLRDKWGSNKDMVLNFK